MKSSAARSLGNRAAAHGFLMKSPVGPDSDENLAALTLDQRGMICDCNHACENLFEYRRGELVWRHVSMLLPELTELELMQNGQPNPRLSYLCHIGRPYRAITREGECFASKLFFTCLENPGHCQLSLIIRPAASPAASLT